MSITMNKFVSIMLLCALCACSSSSDEKDMTLPEILPADGYISPTNCQQFQRGTFIPFDCVFSDNMELGSFNIEIHNNFDHHTHGTEAGECKQDPVRSPVNPWLFNQDYDIPAGEKCHEASLRIPIPEDVDLGEYHFMIRLTDASGWQQLRSVSIRLIENQISL